MINFQWNKNRFLFILQLFAYYEVEPEYVTNTFVSL